MEEFVSGRGAPNAHLNKNGLIAQLRQEMDDRWIFQRRHRDGEPSPPALALEMILVVAFLGPGNNRLMQYLIAAIIGLVGGVASGLFGIGGGIVMVPAMVYFLNTSITTAIGTSLVVIIPTAITGSFKHYQLGNVDWRVAAALIPLAMVGGYFGARLTQLLPAVTLKKMFGGVMILAGLQLILRK